MEQVKSSKISQDLCRKLLANTISVLFTDRYGFDFTANDIIDAYFTQIDMLLPNGMEYWFVRDFKSGPGKSKWFRGVSVLPFPEGAKLAKLNIIGLTNSAITAYHYWQKRSHLTIFIRQYLKKPWIAKNQRLITCMKQ